MAQPAKALATKPDVLNLILRTHMVEEENCCRYTHPQINRFKKKKKNSGIGNGEVINNQHCFCLQRPQVRVPEPTGDS